ncbi:PREDICTED: testis- and ovary-specific PAZ domain-containing protein 1 [Tinamus guttatus]|uniref:testis- and ovary-specific PAZ domain-containing protein 1 n=1 Tax=Tinamus guttatus TaxID=94827 RepID=UPI00052EAFC9|nr:PREDICTED: testis- and ovary-specific PAZ domain-containing protein 1 [Tinamus guttatus]
MLNSTNTQRTRSVEGFSPTRCTFRIFNKDFPGKLANLKKVSQDRAACDVKEDGALEEDSEAGRAAPPVACGRGGGESGRHQSENGYFTTPGWHPTTLYARGRVSEARHVERISPPESRPAKSICWGYVYLPPAFAEKLTLSRLKHKDRANPRTPKTSQTLSSAATPEDRSWGEVLGEGAAQGQWLFPEPELQEEFSAGFGREECDSHGLSPLGLQGWPESPGIKDEFSFMDIKLEIPSSDEEGKSTERRNICSLPEVLPPAKGTCSSEVEGLCSLMVPDLQMPELEESLGTGRGGSAESEEWWPCVQPSVLMLEKSTESPPDGGTVRSPKSERHGKGKRAGKGKAKRSCPCELKPLERVEATGNRGGCPLTGSRETGAPEKKKRRSVGRNGKASLAKPKLQSPQEAGSSSVAEPPAPERGAAGLSGGCFPLPSLSSQEQPRNRGKRRKRAGIEQQRSADLQQGAAKEKWKDSCSQAVKELKTNLNRSEDSTEKKPYSSESPDIATLDGTQSNGYLCHSLAKKSRVQCKKRKKGIDQIKRSQNFSVSTPEKAKNASAKYEAEHYGKALTHCNCLPFVTEKNPVVRLEACSYINTLVKSSVNGTASSFKISGFFHVAQGERKAVCPGSAVEQRAINSSTNGMHNERSPLKGGVLFSKEEKHQHREGYFSCLKSENSRCSRKRKWNTSRRPRKKLQVAICSSPEKTAVQNVPPNTTSKGKECELQAEDPVTTSESSVVFGLNHKEMPLSASYDLTSNHNVGKNTRDTRNRSLSRKNSIKSLALEDCFKEVSELSIVAKRENSNRVAPQGYSANSSGMGVLTQVCDVSNCQKYVPVENLNKTSKKSKRSTSQRTIPMTGKNVWLLESCARTSEWFYKDDRSKSKQEKLLSSDFEKAFVKSSIEAVEENSLTSSLRQLDLHISPAEIKQSAHKIMDLNTECLTSLETPESSSVDSYGTLRISSNENLELPVNTGRSSMASNLGDMQEVKATLNATTKQKDKGAVRKRNPSKTAQNGAATGNNSRKNFSHKASVAKQTLSDLKVIKVLNTGNLSNFKIPLRKNKPESRKLEAVLSFESPLEQPLSAVNVTSATDSMKKKADDASEDLSHEISTLPEHVSFYPHAVVERQLASSGSDSQTSDCVPKSNLPDDSSNAVDHSVALEIHDDSKSKGNLSQHKSESFPDVLEAYKEDILVIDVIQDDPELFGASDDEAPSLTDSENCPAKTSCSGTLITEEKPEFKPQYPVISENKDSRGHCCLSQWLPTTKAEHFDDINPLHLSAHEIKTYISSSASSPLGGVTEDSFEDGQLSELDEFLKGSDMDEEASHSIHQLLEMIELPRKYCRLYFMTLRGCERAKCWFWHVPDQGDEKICMAVLRTYITSNELGLLQRATQIFVNYYREAMPGVDFASQVLNDLLISLLKNCLFQEVFQILNVTLLINMLPAVDVLLKIFEYMASLNVKDAVPALISMFCKLVDAGMFLEFEHFNFIIKFLHQLQVSRQEINTILNIKSRFQEKHFKKNWRFDFSLAMTEIQHCKEKSDWTKLGNLYVSLRTGHERFGDLKKLSLFIAEILSRDSEEEGPGVPFCDFADAVIKNSQSNEADRIFIGRAGISVMYSYHKVLQWIKGRKVLDKLHELKIYFTVLKGLIGPEKSASRCQIVNTAAEFFLKTGSLDGATWVLRESEWITNAPVWPCDKMDILNRHNLLRSLVHQYLSKSLYRQAFEVLQNLPGFQNCSDTVDIPWYSRLFNKLINACFESKNLGISSSAIDFMLSKNIPIDFFLLRGLITSLGRSCLWSKARTYYKSALSLGCYPLLQGNTYHKLLPIPSYLSEVEMLLAIEIFLVSNASGVQSPGATSQALQIILKRCEDPKGQNKDDYQTAVERLILAARLSDPKLFLKYMTMNVNMEEVYSLDLTSALKWLQENMKWAGRVWLFQ